MKCPECSAPYDECDLPDVCGIGGICIQQEMQATADASRPETVGPPK